MGRRLVLGTLLLVMALGGIVQAHSLTYESDEGPLFSLSIPREWSVRTAGTRVVAAPADLTMWLGAWELEKRDATDVAMEDASHYLTAWFEDIQTDPAEKIRINGMACVRLNGTATHEGNAVRFSAVIFEPRPTRICLALGVWDDESQARTGPIEAALGSLRPAPGG